MSDTAPTPPHQTDLSAAEQAELMATAHAMADAARAAILPHFRSSDLATDNKDPDDFDPVTIADRAAEAAMRAVLADRRPQDAILGEEEAAKPGTSGLTWVIDPIDGTRGFVAGTPTWGVLIALSDASGPRYGIVDQPYIGERFEGGFGLSQLTGPLGQTPTRTRPTAQLSDAVLFTTFPEVGSDAERRGFEAVRDRVQLVRYGMDCYAYALIAAGQVDLVIEAGLASYDISAPIAVVEAAGGIVTDWHGRPVHAGGRAVAASNPAMHAAALDLLRPFADG